jgi:hypothetical protein
LVWSACRNCRNLDGIPVPQHVEEEALQAAFGSEYEEYKKITWKLFPGF